MAQRNHHLPDIQQGHAMTPRRAEGLAGHNYQDPYVLSRASRLGQRRAGLLAMVVPSRLPDNPPPIVIDRSAAPAEQRRQAVEGRLYQIKVASDEWAYVHQRLAARWGRLYFTLGLPAAVLAAIAGATSLLSTTGRVAAGLIALASSAITGAAAFLDSQSRRAKHLGLAAEWYALGRDAELHLIYDLSNTEWVAQSEAELNRLSQRETDLYRGQLPPRGPELGSDTTSTTA
jgi:hypothetical protein